MLARLLRHWGVDALPDDPAARLGALHDACVRHVPFENVTKILRARDAVNAGRARRTPGVFWRDHLKHGAGGTCFSATDAFRWLLAEAGLPAEPAFAILPREKPQGHVVLLVEAGDGLWLSDVGYSLAMPLPLPKRGSRSGSTRVASPHYDLEIRRGPGGDFLLFTEDDSGPRFRYRFRAEPVTRAAYERAWRETLQPDAPYMSKLAMGRMGRRRRWLYRGCGEIVVIHRGVTRPRRVADAAALSRWFGLPEAMIYAAMDCLARRAPGR